MVLHNGKKEVWSKLKYVCDLLLFVHEYGGTFNWDSFIAKLDNQSIEKNLMKGLTLVNLFLPLSNIIIISKEIPKAKALNISFWENALRYELNLKARFDFVRLKFSNHKSLKESYYYLTQYLKYLSYPTPQATRLVQFPRSYKLLNLSSTVVSYIYFSAFKRKN